MDVFNHLEHGQCSSRKPQKAPSWSVAFQHGHLVVCFSATDEDSNFFDVSTNLTESKNTNVVLFKYGSAGWINMLLTRRRELGTSKMQDPRPEFGALAPFNVTNMFSTTIGTSRRRRPWETALDSSIRNRLTRVTLLSTKHDHVTSFVCFSTVCTYLARVMLRTCRFFWGNVECTHRSPRRRERSRRDGQ